MSSASHHSPSSPALAPLANRSEAGPLEAFAEAGPSNAAPERKAPPVMNPDPTPPPTPRQVKRRLASAAEWRFDNTKAPKVDVAHQNVQPLTLRRKPKPKHVSVFRKMQEEQDRRRRQASLASSAAPVVPSHPATPAIHPTRTDLAAPRGPPATGPPAFHTHSPSLSSHAGFPLDDDAFSHQAHEVFPASSVSGTSIGREASAGTIQDDVDYESYTLEDEFMELENGSQSDGMDEIGEVEELLNRRASTVPPPQTGGVHASMWASYAPDQSEPEDVMPWEYQRSVSEHQLDPLSAFPQDVPPLGGPSQPDFGQGWGHDAATVSDVYPHAPVDHQQTGHAHRSPSVPRQEEAFVPHPQQTYALQQTYAPQQTYAAQQQPYVPRQEEFTQQQSYAPHQQPLHVPRQEDPYVPQQQPYAAHQQSLHVPRQGDPYVPPRQEPYVPPQHPHIPPQQQPYVPQQPTYGHRQEESYVPPQQQQPRGAHQEPPYDPRHRKPYTLPQQPRALQQQPRVPEQPPYALQQQSRVPQQQSYAHREQQPDNPPPRLPQAPHAREVPQTAAQQQYYAQDHSHLTSQRTVPGHAHPQLQPGPPPRQSNAHAPAYPPPSQAHSQRQIVAQNTLGLFHALPFQQPRTQVQGHANQSQHSVAQSFQQVDAVNFQFIEVDADTAKAGANANPRTRSSAPGASTAAGPSNVVARTRSQAKASGAPAPGPSNVVTRTRSKTTVNAPAEGHSKQRVQSKADVAPAPASSKSSALPAKAGPSQIAPAQADSSNLSDSPPPRPSRTYVRPAGPAPYVPPPGGPAQRSTNKGKAPMRASSARSSPHVSKRTRIELAQLLESLPDSDDRAVVEKILFPDGVGTSDQENISDGDDQDMEIDEEGHTSRHSNEEPPVAIILDKVNHVETFMRGEAKKSEKIWNDVHETLTQVQEDVSELKASRTPRRKHAIEARRTLKAPRASLSRKAQLEQGLPPNFHKWPAQDQANWYRAEKNHLDQLSTYVKTHFKFLLECSTWEDLPKKHPELTQEQINRYKEGGANVGIYDVFEDKKYHIDFVHGWTSFPFNIGARKEFIRHFISSVNAGWYSKPAVDKKYIAEFYIGCTLDTYMVTCRRNYKAVVKPPSQADLDKRADDTAKNNRRGTLLDQRQAVCTRRNWSKFDKMWDKLEPAHMSGDETDGEEKRHPPRWSIIRAGWMSKKLRRCLRKLDRHYKADWENPKRYGKKRRTGGNPPRHRVESKNPKVQDGWAPTGLWRNCYSRRWLATLKPWDIERLQVIDADFDFSLPEEPPRHADDEDSDVGSSSSVEDIDVDDDDDGAFMDADA